MTLAIVHTRAILGIHARPVTVEVDISAGLPGFSIVGLAETAVKESKDRVRSALLNCHFDQPARRITVNLAPADVPKEGSRYDLPIAIGILAASEQIPRNALCHYEFAGELALSGDLRPISGSLPFAIACKEDRHVFICPHINAPEANLPGDIEVLGAQHLQEVCDHLSGLHMLTPHVATPSTAAYQYPELSDVCGQQQAKRALTLAAAGEHSVLMVGPPGTGKTMLASRLPGLLPPLGVEDALTSAAVASIHGRQFNYRYWQQRPFRAPHHTASSAALVGGGNPPKPGEISLAHNGVLFLDELPEFSRKVLETLREPLESKHIVISRAANQAEFPANFQLIAAMNPCPCGYLTDPQRDCVCSREQIARYRNKLSGPFLDRIDCHFDVPAIPIAELMQQQQKNNYPTTATVRDNVCRARKKQLKRQQCTNAHLKGEALLDYCQLHNQAHAFLLQALEKFNLSARAYHRVLRLARTIADIDERIDIDIPDLAEALSYRPNKGVEDLL